ncbi:MAG: type I pullulanase, partial [Clostridiales bacterium]|nr:type I pullulanase [Clostridiales bacterium]
MKRKKMFLIVLSITVLISLILTMIPANEVYAETTSTIVINYNRPDGDYEKWNLWVWAEGEEGEVFHFDKETSFGVKAIIDLPGDVKKAGFIVRTDAWEKDVEVDRFIEIEDGFVEIWVNSGQEEFVYDKPDALVDDVEHEEIQLNIHYYRFDGEYEGWNLWIWRYGQDGEGVEFTEEDEYGRIARIVLDGMVDIERIGIIVRRSEGGNEWAAKDVDEDRFIAVARACADGVINVFLMQQTAKIGFVHEDMDRSPRIVNAVFRDTTVIDVEVNVPFKWDENTKELFELKSEDVKEEIEEIIPLDKTDDNYVRRISIVISNPIELDRRYKLSMLGYGLIEISTQSCAIFSSQDFYDKFHYYGDDLGATYSKENTIFRVWAPTATGINLLLYEEGYGGELKQRIEMKRDIKGTWLLQVDGDLHGVFYTYEVHVNGAINEVVDKYAKAVGVDGRRGMVVDLSKTNPPGWENLQRPPLENFVDAVIWELHVRDLSMNENSGITNKGKFLGIIEEGTRSPEGKKTGLDHMLELGINHLHLLPVFDFRSIDETNAYDVANVFNWGYDPLNYNVPEGTFSTDPWCGVTRIKEFKKMVQGLNENGIRVIMDVVYNHTGYTANSHLNLLVPGYFYRFRPDGSFSDGSACGNELADERSMVRKMIIDSVVFWATEYKIDGFRFDLMGLHDIETMNEIRKALDKIDPSIIIYGEGWAAGSTPLPSYRQALKVNMPRMPRIAAFSDDIRDGIKGNVFDAEAPGFVNGGLGFEDSIKFGIVASTKHDQINYAAVNYSNAPWAMGPEQAITYASSHDNHTLWDKLYATNPNDSIEERIKMHKLSSAIVLTSQGVPFLHAGVEMLRTKGGDDNSYEAPDSVNMLDWSRKATYNEVFQYHRGLIELRRQRPAFRMTSTEDIQRHLRFLDMPQRNMVGYILSDNANGDEWETIAVLFNGNAEDIEITLPGEGWGVVVNGKVAGTEIIERISQDKVTVPARTAMVLV